jgi:hypothetical protein
MGRFKSSASAIMFQDLYDEVSLLWSRLWPVADGMVTEVVSERLGRDQERIRLAVAYEFSIGDDGPYTGESFWTPAFCQLRRVADARKRIRKRQRIQVRYRSSDPSVNTLNGGVRRLLKNLRA